MIILPVLVLLLTALLIIVVRLLRPAFSYFWLIAVVGALLAWPLVFLGRSRIPLAFPLPAWQPAQLFSFSPVLLLDGISWPFALSIATLTLATILTDVIRDDRSSHTRSNWSALAGELILATAGLLAVFSGNLLTLLLTWAILDFIELIIWLGDVSNKQDGEQVIIGFSTRILGYVLVLWACITMIASGARLNFDELVPNASIYLLLAAGVRLGALPLNIPFPNNLPAKRGKRTLLRLIPTAAGLVLLVRVAIGIPVPTFTPILLLLAGISAIFGSLSWASAAEETAGMQFWIIAMASLALGSAIVGQPNACLAWGLALLLSGGQIFLLSARSRWLIFFPLLGAISISTLPFTPSWQGTQIYQLYSHPLTLVFLPAQIFLLAGYLRHAFRLTPSLTSSERWTLVIYPWGLFLLLLTQYGLLWWTYSNLPGMSQVWPTLPESLIGSIGAVFGLVVYAWWSRRKSTSTRFRTRLLSMLSLVWIYRYLWNIYYFMRRVFATLNKILEGRAGLLWAFLILTLLLSMFSQLGG